MKWIEYFIAGQSAAGVPEPLFKGPVLREERTEGRHRPLAPDGPGLGLELDETVAAASLVQD